MIWNPDWWDMACWWSDNTMKQYRRPFCLFTSSWSGYAYKKLRFPLKLVILYRPSSWWHEILEVLSKSPRTTGWKFDRKKNYKLLVMSSFKRSHLYFNLIKVYTISSLLSSILMLTACFHFIRQWNIYIYWSINILWISDVFSVYIPVSQNLLPLLTFLIPCLFVLASQDRFRILERSEITLSQDGIAELII